MEVWNFIRDINLWYAAILAVGLIFVIIEMFHPGFGAPGITGAILLLVGVLLLAKTVLQALILIAIILAILGVALTFVLQSATKGRLAKTLVLSHTQHKESGYVGTEDLQFFLGKEGAAITPLRPSGTADFDGIKLDVVSEGEFIDAGTRVKIMKVEGRRIVVRKMMSQI